jgi:rRNA maturation endonuclease Nob1
MQQLDEALDIKKHILKLKARTANLPAIQFCHTCKRPISDRTHRYCIICGSPILQPGKVSNMYYKSIKLSENGKAVVCPHCDNEELTFGEYCMICGNNIVNRCADTPDTSHLSTIIPSCKTLLPGNARFCPKCGNESTFYQKGWLRDWKSENTKRAIENIHEIQNERKHG